MAVLPAQRDGALWLGCPETASSGLRIAITSRNLLGAGAVPQRLARIRFDEALPVYQRWSYGRHGAGPADAATRTGFLSALKTSRQISVDLTDYRLQPRQFQFTVDPAATRAMIGKVARACRARPRDR